MRKLFILSIISLLLLGCKSYVQVFNTNSSIQTNDKGFYIYENDTIKITYSFWQNNGLMSFSIFNKLDRPLYIDWKKSSYIDNSVKLNYWVDEEKSKAISSYGSYFYDGPLLKPGYAVSVTEGASFSSKVKVERITFIPPQSNYYRSQFYILPVRFYKLDTKTSYEEVSRNDKPNKKTKIYKATFSKENSSIIFRNFLTFSLTEDFKSEFYIDNRFYVEEILEMDERHFNKQPKLDPNRKRKWFLRDENGNVIFYSDFENPKSFYLNIPREGSIEYRK